MYLSDLFDINLGFRMDIEGICSDSRLAEPGYIYFAVEGQDHDGHDFIEQAVDRGASVVVHTKELQTYRKGVCYIRVDDIQDVLGKAARLFYGFPAEDMVMFGVTGTNGKSTVCSLIRWFMDNWTACGYIGTIAVEYGGKKLLPTLTTPDVITLQSVLSDMKSAGMNAVAMEVSSHGLVQKRVDGILFDVAVFTNLTYDHLDYHRTMDAYLEAKDTLFSDHLSVGGTAVLNADDPASHRLHVRSGASVVWYGIGRNLDYWADEIKYSGQGSSFTLHHKRASYRVHSPLAGRFNVSNLLAAIAACHAAGMPLRHIVELCGSIPQVEGRMQNISAGQPFQVLVDFAHTPDGVEQVMKYAREAAGRSRVIAVFGSAGKRDAAKRPVFGTIADQYADLVILTEDDPRNEDIHDISCQIQAGIHNTECRQIPDRLEAIRTAIREASPGDVVLLLGKGCEPYMYRKDGREPWIGDDKAALAALQELNAD